MLTFAGACDNTPSAESKTQQVVNSQNDIYNNAQPLHTYPYSNERAIVQQLYDARVTKNLNTWTVWISNNGIPLGMCPSKGFPIPYTTSLTNPQQITYSTPWGNGNGHIEGVIGQAEPNGLYPGTSMATWIMCLDADGSTHPQYMEPLVMAYTYPVEIRNGQIVKVGNGTADSAIQIKTP